MVALITDNVQPGTNVLLVGNAFVNITDLEKTHAQLTNLLTETGKLSFEQADRLAEGSYIYTNTSIYQVIMIRN